MRDSAGLYSLVRFVDSHFTSVSQLCAPCTATRQCKPIAIASRSSHGCIWSVATLPSCLNSATTCTLVVPVRSPEKGGGQRFDLRLIPRIQYTFPSTLSLQREQNYETESEGRSAVELVVDSDVHSFLIGQDGCNIRDIRDGHNVRILFPLGRDSASSGKILIVGNRAEDVDRARKDLEQLVLQLVILYSNW